MSCSTKGSYVTRTNKHSRHQENNTFRPIRNDHGQTTHQTSELRRKGGTRRSRTFKNSTWDKAPNAKPQFVINENGEKDDSDTGFQSGLDCYDGIKNGSGSKSSLDSNNVKTEVVDIEDSEKGVEKQVDGLIINDETGNEDDDDPVKRLEELRLNVDESELLEEIMNINNQLQEDELLAMESIYGDNIVILENQNGLRCFQVNIPVEVPDGIAITTKLNSPDFSYSFKVEYLPPINLTCFLPKSYPSNHAPLFTISVQWLNSTKISDLCHKLDSIWKDQSGQEVIYSWVEWLQDCSLSHLGFESEIVIGTHDLKGEKDRRAISGSVSPDIDILSIKSYNDEQHHDFFCRNTQECCICFSEYPGSDFARLPCKHFFCWKCLTTFSAMHVMEGTVFKIQCPDLKCDSMIPPGLLKRLLGDEEFERWESLMLQKTLESMNDMVYCPRCETACLKDEDHQAQCAKCYYNFCTLCRETRHVGVACITPEMKLLTLKERQNSTLMNDKQKRREADIINQLKNIKEIRSSAKQCPSCKMAISRISGCDHMRCDNCGKSFCYRCTQPLDKHLSPCVESAEKLIQKWEKMNDRQALAQLRVEMFADKDNVHSCPLCGQNNARVGNNNHIFCWACQSHYCYLCRKIIRRASQHYRLNGCKQHTVG